MSVKTTYGDIRKFVNQINSCSTIEKEQEVIQKELAKIRNEFSNPKITAHDRMINSYKLVFINTLGYEVDYGMVEVITSLANSKFIYKHAGYLTFLTCYRNVPGACSLLINTMQHDLQNTKNEVICETLSTLAVISDAQIAEVVGQTVMNLAFNNNEVIIRKKALLVLKQMFKFFPSLINLEPQFIKKVELLIQKEYDLGVVQSLCKLLYEVILKDKNNGVDLKKYQCLSLSLVQIFKGLLTEPNYEITYHGVSMPWLVIVLIKLIPLICIEKREIISFQSLCEEFLQIGFTDFLFGIPSSQRDITFSIEIEIIKYSFEFEVKRLANISISLLGKLLEVNDININYLTLDLLIIACQNGFKESTKKLFAKVILLGKSFDIELKKRVIDTLFSMCDSSNVINICQVYNEMINNEDLIELKEDLIFKLCILAEKYLKGKEYVDIMMSIAFNGGNYISFELWNRTLKKLHDDQEATKYCIFLIEKLIKKSFGSDNFIELCCLILGEYGEYCEDILSLTHALILKFRFIKDSTKIRIITALMKLLKKFNSIKDLLMNICIQYQYSNNCELQQRVKECLYLLEHPSIIPIVIDSLVYKDTTEEELKTVEDKESIDEVKGTPSLKKASTIKNDDRPNVIKKQFKFNFYHSLNPNGLYEKVEIIYRKIMSLNEGIIFQDQNIQIGYRSKVIDNVVGIQLFYGNMSPFPITVNIHIIVPDGLTSSLQQDNLTIESHQQINHIIQFKLNATFLEPPQLQLDYHFNSTSASVSLPLPITLLKFFKQPTQMTFSSLPEQTTIHCLLTIGQIQSLCSRYNLVFQSNDQVVETHSIIPSLGEIKIQLKFNSKELSVSSSNEQMNLDIIALILYSLQ
ncbi:AP-2 complex subunit alpha, putative [Entamoeba histolytica HM-3:IMSS]|uniref:AP-2 complex subunit alpha n=2 Tax=Entamoeba histolytica TaxID=5759 RepID=M2S0H0_ENTHI|nr:AP2 complex subunit alpha, putative [Entamoeba histolytica KU27]EMS13233.1 AP-2 complex subunit alpha, putative [Entamoeba histolytica HM-3:IMSS]